MSSRGAGPNLRLILPTLVLLLWLGSALFAPLLAPSHYGAMDLDARLEGPSPDHPLGTDDLGRDLLSRFLYGGRVSLAVSAAGLLLALVLGITCGAVSGYAGGWIDMGMSRIMDMLMALPGILLAVAIVAYVGKGFIPLILALSCTAWVGYARLVRSLTLSMKERPFVEASRSMGGTPQFVVLRHILPNTFSVLAVQAAAGCAGVVLSESALSFLGLGIQPPYPSWGEMLAVGCDYLLEAPHLAGVAGTAIFLAVWSLYSLGEGLSDILDPSRRYLAPVI
jgi:peptide/nickel transport system permease protein